MAKHEQKAVSKYFKLKEIADNMVHNGVNDLDPIIRSIFRQMWKVYNGMTAEDRRIVDFKEEMEVQFG